MDGRRYVVGAKQGDLKYASVLGRQENSPFRQAYTTRGKEEENVQETQFNQIR